MYQVNNWDAQFENFTSRKIGHPAWVYLPNAQDTRPMLRLLSLPDGLTVIGVWHLLVQYLSKQPKPRAGWLTEDGTRGGDPMTVEDLARLWRSDTDVIKRAIDALCDVGLLTDYGKGAQSERSDATRTERPISQDDLIRVSYRRGGEGSGVECRGLGARAETTIEEKAETQERSNRETNPPVPNPPLPVTACRLGIMELRASGIVGMKLGPEHRDEMIALANEVGLEVLREGVNACRAQGIPTFPDRVTEECDAIINRRAALAAVPPDSPYELGMQAAVANALDLVSSRGWEACRDAIGMGGVSCEADLRTALQDNRNASVELVAALASKPVPV